MLMSKDCELKEAASGSMDLWPLAILMLGIMPHARAGSVGRRRWLQRGVEALGSGWCGLNSLCEMGHLQVV